MDSRYAVVGAGLMGAATAWRLAQRGHEVTLLERARPATPDGSSHGSARIFRYVYPDPFYTALVVRARAAYDELEQVSGRELITTTGALDFGHARDTRGLARVLEEVGVEHELLAAAQARDRFGGIAVDTETLWHPGAGVIDAEATVAAMVSAFTALGGQVLCPWPVRHIEASPRGYRVHGDDGARVDAERVVVAAGAWFPGLLDRLPLEPGLRAALPDVRVSQENAYHFPYREPERAWPTFIHREPAIRTYSLPGGRDAGWRGQKLAEFLGGRPLDGAENRDGRIDPANRARMIAYVERYLPGLEPEPYAETTCLFTMTPTEDFLVDGHGGLTLVSACSGHGAKFAPLIGEIAADAATGSGDVPARFRAGLATWGRTGASGTGP